jgi:parallel beta-helix repeat protein
MRSSLRGALRVLGLSTLLLALVPALASASTVSVLSYGAVGNGSTNDRAAIQAAIAAQHTAGGGTVEFPYRSSCSNSNGVCNVYLSGNLVLKSKVTLLIPSNVTLKQSTYAGQDGGRNDFTYTPLLGHTPPEGESTAAFAVNALTNQPFIYATEVSEVAVSGGSSLGGTIQMGEGGEDNPYLEPIGFYKVNGYTISNLHIDGAHGFNLALFTTENGTVSGNSIIASDEVNTDGVSLQNSQNVTVSKNTIENDDDGVYVWESYDDPRGGGSSWWSSATPQPTENITFEENDISTYPGAVGSAGALRIIPWGAGAPNQASVEMRNVSYLDNTESDPIGVGCWCDDPYHGETYQESTLDPMAEDDASPMTGFTFSGNTYEDFESKAPEFVLSPDVITDLQADWGEPREPSALYFQNGGFEDSGMPYWSRVGPTSDVGASDEPSKGQDGSWFGYMQHFSAGYEALYQGIALYGGNSYDFRLRTESSGKPFRMFVYDTCNGASIATSTFENTSWATKSLGFTVPAGDTCGDFHIGVDNSIAGYTYGSSDSVRIDDASLTETGFGFGLPDAISDHSPQVVHTGTWVTAAEEVDFRGVHSYTGSPGASVTIPFVGTSAELVAITAPNLGVADVSVDGGTAVKVNEYSASEAWKQVVYDIGTLTYGLHTIKISYTGETKGGSEPYIDFEALQVK